MRNREKPVAVITGAARGLGAALAEKLAVQGYRVALIGLEPALLEATAAHIGADAIALHADVADQDALSQAIGKAAAQWGRIDVVVANAGIGNFAFLKDISPQEFRRTMSVNVDGVFHTFQAALPHLTQSRGYALAIASIAAASGPPGLGAYGASKAAIEAMCDTWRAEIAHTGVGIGVAYFGWLDTDLVRTAGKVDAFDTVRRMLPGPLKSVLKPDIAVEALLKGIKRRKKRVMAPWWIGWVMALRWFIAADTARFGKSMPMIERLHAEQRAREGDNAGFTTDPAGKS